MRSDEKKKYDQQTKGRVKHLTQNRVCIVVGRETETAIISILNFYFRYVYLRSSGFVFVRLGWRFTIQSSNFRGQ